MDNQKIFLDAAARVRDGERSLVRAVEAAAGQRLTDELVKHLDQALERSYCYRYWRHQFNRRVMGRYSNDYYSAHRQQGYSPTAIAIIKWDEEVSLPWSLRRVLARAAELAEQDRLLAEQEVGRGTVGRMLGLLTVAQGEMQE